MSGCIISLAEICGLNQDKKYGGRDARGYAAASNAPNMYKGNSRLFTYNIYMYVYILEKLLHMKQVKLPLSRGKSSLRDDLEVV